MNCTFQIEPIRTASRRNDLPRGSLTAANLSLPSQIEHTCSVLWVIGAIPAPSNPRSQFRRHEDAVSLSSSYSSYRISLAIHDCYLEAMGSDDHVEKVISYRSIESNEDLLLVMTVFVVILYCVV